MRRPLRAAPAAAEGGDAAAPWNIVRGGGPHCVTVITKIIVVITALPDVALIADHQKPWKFIAESSGTDCARERGASLAVFS